MATKNIGIHLTKKIKELSNKTYKPQMNEIEEDVQN